MEASFSSPERTSLFYQHFSWGRFTIPHEAFRRVLSAHSVFSPYFDFVRAFGVKRNEDESNWNGHRFRSLPGRSGKDRSLSYGINSLWSTRLEDIAYLYWPEFCYNIQYVELNKRRKGNPWSLRTMGLYQQINSITHRSVDILLQPSDGVRQCYETALTRKHCSNELPCVDPIALHILVISSAVANWQPYLEGLQRELTALVRPCPTTKIYLIRLIWNIIYQG